MATIKSQMVLNDGISGVLKKIITALDTTLNAFEQVQRASGNAIDVSNIEAARGGLVEAARDVNNMAEGYRLAAQEEERLNNGINRGASAMDGMLGKVKNLAAAVGAAFGVKQLFSLSDQMTSNTARLSLIVDDGGSVEALEAKIMASAQRSRAAYLDTANAIASMGANAGAAFSGNDELIAFMEQVNKQFVIGGASAQGQSAAMLQLTQAMAAGALRGEELNSILENAPGIARAIESYMGIAEGSIKQYAQEGAVTAEVVKNALFAAADETNAKFESMPMTWGQIWTSMQNRALTALDPVLSKVNHFANSKALQTFSNGAITAFGVLAAVAGAVIALLINGATFIADNWSWIEPIVWGVVAALGAYGTVLLAVNGAQMVHNALEAVSNGLKTVAAAHSAMKAGASLAEAAATNTATGAQIGLNAALLASPITWVVIGVIALIAAVVGVIRYLDVFGAKSTSVFGTFMGVLNVVWQFICNVGAGIAAVFFACCSNVETAFHNTIANVQGWWYGLLSTALTVVEGICAALNKLPFVEFDYSGISAQADEFAAKSAEAYGSVKEYESIGDAWGSAWSDNWQADAFQAGAAWGDGIADKVGGFFDGFGTDPSNMGEDPGGGSAGYIPYDELSKGVGDISDNTGSMAKSLEVSGEELEYLRDIAERDAINRFTTAEVKIDMTGMTNKIDGGADLDGVIRELTDGFTEALVTAAEGVHA